jgi:hypothetical protein
MPARAMSRPDRRRTVLVLLFALLFQLGAAAAAGLPSQSCCGSCDVIAAPADVVPAPHCAAPGQRHHGDPTPTHRHGPGPCPLCGDHSVAAAPFIVTAVGVPPIVAAPPLAVAWRSSALPPPLPDRLERPPRGA